MSDKANINEHVEDVLAGALAARTGEPFGTVELISSSDEVVLIPTPTRDPRDPLNLPAWRRVIIMLTTSICKSELSPTSQSPDGGRNIMFWEANALLQLAHWH